MSRKRQIKRLMALGIQRNDAAGFVKASRILTEKGMHHLLPAPLCNPLPVIVSKREMRTFVACYTLSRYYEQTTTDAKEKAEYIKIKLGQELGIGLLESGLCKIQAKTDIYADAVRYQATIDVAVPEYGPEPARPWERERTYTPNDIEAQYEAFRRMTVEPIHAQLHMERDRHGGGKA